MLCCTFVGRRDLKIRSTPLKFTVILWLYRVPIEKEIEEDLDPAVKGNFVLICK